MHAALANEIFDADPAGTDLLAQALQCKGLTARQLTDEVDSMIGVADIDMLVLSGSLAEGLGNVRSDLDVLLITGRPDMVVAQERSLLLFVDGHLLDLSVVALAPLHELVQRLAAWAAQPRDARDPAAFDPAERKLLHRIATGLPLHGGAAFARLQAQVPRTALAQHLIALSSYMASTFQVDMAGFYRSADALSLHFASQQLLGHLMDALLASHGITTGNPKWRSRQLAALGGTWEAGLHGRPTALSAHELFLAASTFSVDDAAQTIRARATALATLARRLLPMLAGGARTDAVVARSATAAGGSGPRLPQLDLDVTVKFRHDCFELFRLNQRSAIFGLSAREYAVICLCDGVTTVEDARRHIAAHWGEAGAQALVDQVVALITFGNLELPAYVDETALARLLAA